MGTLEDRLHSTTDASVWAEEFLRVINNGATPDFGMMVGWFANAIETGRSAGEQSR